MLRAVFSFLFELHGDYSYIRYIAASIRAVAPGPKNARIRLI